MHYPQALAAFDQMVEKMHADLQRYALKPDASEKYIAIQNNRIRVCDIFKEAAEVEIRGNEVVASETMQRLQNKLAVYENIIKCFNLLADTAHIDPYNVELAMRGHLPLIEQQHQGHLACCDKINRHHNYWRNRYLKNPDSDYSAFTRLEKLKEHYAPQSS